MKRKGLSMLLFAIACTVVLALHATARAQLGIGAKYGTRDPHTCTDSSQPKGNTITADKAKEYVYCGESYTTQYMYLYDEVTIKQIGTPRPYNMNQDINVPNIDARIPVSPIRGSLKSYQCDLLGIIEPEKYRGHNCRINNEPNAEGLCYKDSFKNWHCSMVDVATASEIARDAPPPGGASPAKIPPVKKTPPKPPAGNDTPPPNDKDQGAPPADNNGSPTKPDFSAMLKWFDLVRFEFTDDGKLNIVVKRKINGGPAGFVVEFRDADGVLIDREPVPDYTLNSARVGEVAKTSVGVPSEADMKRVASVKVVKL